MPVRSLPCWATLPRQGATLSSSRPPSARIRNSSAIAGAFAVVGERRFASSAGFMVSKRRRREEEGQPRRGATPGRGSSPLQLGPSDLAAAVRVASQGPRAGDLRMWRSYAEAVLFQAGALRPKQLAFITNGFARAQVPDREVFRRLADRAVEEVAEFEPRDTALLLNAYAKLVFRDLDLFSKFSQVIRGESGIGYGEQHLALIANAYARLDIADDGLFRVLSGWIIKRSSEFTPQGIATVTNAFAKVQARDEKLFQTLADTIVDRGLLARLESQHLANLLNAHAKLHLGDAKTLKMLVGRIPAKVHEFSAVEVAATLNAVTKLSITDHRTLLALASTVKERAEEFRARQMAQVLHAFSTLTTSYGKLLKARTVLQNSASALLKATTDCFATELSNMWIPHASDKQDVSPHILSFVDDAEDQSLALVFCAFARVGQSPNAVMGALLQRLEHRVAELELAVQVQLFYACGRLGLSSETLATSLAVLLRPRVNKLFAQHVSNCLFACGRLGLNTEEVAALVGALQSRLARGGLELEPQHCANVLHALATLHGQGVAPPAVPAPLSGTVVPAVLARVLKYKKWVEHPQLLASVAVSCARLRHRSTPLFRLASDVVKAGERGLSTQGVADLLAAFAVAEAFDLDLFSWALSQLPGTPGSIPTPAMFTCLGALDYANHVFADAGGFIQWPEVGTPNPLGMTSLLFPAAPAPFRKQVLDFYALVGLTLLVRAERLSARSLMDAAVPFARARLLSMVPFDLLGLEARRKVESLALEKPLEPLQAPDLADLGETFGSERDGETEQHVQDTILDFLRVQATSSSESSTTSPGRTLAVSLARRLARYSALLPGGSGTAHDFGSSEGAAAAPPVVVDPIIRLAAKELAARAEELDFAEITDALCTLSDAGLRPRALVGSLLSMADAKFPPPPSPDDGAAAAFLQAVAVADLCRGLAGQPPPTALFARLAAFAEGLMRVDAVAPMFGEQACDRDAPLKTLAALLSTLHSAGGLSSRLLESLLVSMLKHGVLHGNVGTPQDLIAVVVALSPMTVSANLTAPGSVASGVVGAHRLLDDVLALAAARLATWAASGAASPTPQQLLQLLQTAMSQAASANSLAAPVASNPGVTLLASVLAERAAAASQELGPSGVCSCLGLFARMQLLSKPTAGAAEAERFAGIERRATEVVSVAHRAAVANRDAGPASPQIMATVSIVGTCAVGERLPRALSTIMGAALTWQRRLGVAEASQAAFFCAMALDAQAFSDADRLEARQGLAHLLEGLCWERQKWSAEDHRYLCAVAELLRAEFPELLRDQRWLSRSAQETLQALRRH